MVDTIIEGKMDVETLIEHIKDHYTNDENVRVWVRIHKVGEQ